MKCGSTSSAGQWTKFRIQKKCLNCKAHRWNSFRPPACGKLDSIKWEILSQSIQKATTVFASNPTLSKPYFSCIHSSYCHATCIVNYVHTWKENLDGFHSFDKGKIMALKTKNSGGPNRILKQDLEVGVLWKHQV